MYTIFEKEVNTLGRASQQVYHEHIHLIGIVRHIGNLTMWKGLNNCWPTVWWLLHIPLTNFI